MKTALLLGTTLGVLVTAPAYAQSFNDRVVETLRQQGFETVEIKNGLTQTKLESVRDITKLEVVYDRETGEILKQGTERFVGTFVEGQPIEIGTRDSDFLDDDDDEDDDDGDDDDEDYDDDDDDDHDSDDREDDDGDDDDDDD
ncbi:MAG: PepSY domain-containing protein [Tateyamaria sp.]|uniref:PepSY domain-containing protein n=1 Tax=Tateyamaria sp. TaxID=1929288 RepID=UPI00327A4D19